MTISSDFPFESKFIEVNGSMLHYIERGKGRVFLFLHGNPTWSYLWRNVIPPVAKHARCLAVDLIGFGKSDKPKITYTFLEHYQYIEGFIRKMGLKDLVLVGHDWGGVLAFYYALNHYQNVKGMAFMETFPFTFTWNDFPGKFGIVFRLFRTPLIGHFLIMVLNLFVNQIIPVSVYGGISKEIHQHYKAPFPTIRSRYPIYVWPNELPIAGRENQTFRAIQRVEEKLPAFTFPMLLLSSRPGAILGKKKVNWLKGMIQDLTIVEVGKGLHYIQEDNPEAIAKGIVKWAKGKKLLEPQGSQARL